MLFWSGIIGNVLDHYDSALYVFLAPFLASVFFPKQDFLSGLIMIYGLKSTSIIMRPLGAMFFGRLAIKYQIKNILAITLIGIAICTCLIGFLPTYDEVGILAPILLTLTRSLQGFFAAGEHTIAALFIIELDKSSNKGKSSSYYLCSTMAGSMLASLAATIISYSSNPYTYWRVAFIAGLITAIFGIIIRTIVAKNQHFKTSKNTVSINSYQLILKNKYKILKIMIISSFSFLTYTIPFVFLNNFVPLVSDIKTNELLAHNTGLMIINIILLPIFGNIVDKFDHAKWMALMSFLITITIIPFFYLLPNLSLIGVTIAKLWIVVIGVAFVAPLYALMFKLVNGEEKYLIAGLGYSIGTDLLGRNLPFICLILWQYSKVLWVPSLYLALISLATTLILIKESRKST